MKVKKRDQEERAFHQGYKAAIRGHSTDFCPYTSRIVARGNWFSGWREGRGILGAHHGIPEYALIAH